MDMLERARWSLEGLSVGDAFGECYFRFASDVESLIARRAVATAPWLYTDDTEMALSIFSMLREHGTIEQDGLALMFARRMDAQRGYGANTYRLLRQVLSGQHWRFASAAAFEGQGSCGNGAAMRVAPLGAYFADDIEVVVENARRSAEVTHAHTEGIAGAIAVAVAAAYAWQLRSASPIPQGREFLDLILPHVPDSAVRDGIRRARNLPEGSSVRLAATALGTGDRVTAQDTVPFSLWCAAQYLDNFEDAMWLTVSGLGDRDTTCAIVGGIVASHTGLEGIPEEWLRRREPLPEWAIER